MSEPTTASPVLAYADLPARMGIQYEVREGQVKIVLPPTPVWKRPEFVIPVFVLAVWLGQIVLAMRQGMAPFAIVFVLACIFICATISTVTRDRRRVKLVVNAYTIHLENVRPLWVADAPKFHTLTYARGGVYDVHFVPDTGNVIIRIRGQEMVEIKPSNNREIDEWIALELRRALGLPS